MEDNQYMITDVDQPPVSAVRQKLQEEPPWPSHCCIFRVPSSIRRHNIYAYNPHLVSIGPYHRHKRKLQAMEKFKYWYLKCLLDRAPTPETNLECFAHVIKSTLSFCLGCYAEPVNLSDDQFVEMLILDGCFVVELFRKKANIVPLHPDDPIFKTSYMGKILLIDLLLLENQIPWCVLDSLFHLTAPSSERSRISLDALAFDYFDFNTLKTGDINPNSVTGNKHLLDLQRNNLLSSYTEKDPERTNWYTIPCVTRLLKAGVQFEVGKSNEMMDVQFNNGVIRIPPIMILDNAESFLRNLIAFEQCDASCKDKITSYAILLDNLIETSEDFEFLRHKKIIICYLPSEEIYGCFKGLYKDVNVVYHTYAKLSRDISEFYGERWPRWRVTLLQDYFNNPWSISSFLAAVVILLLTFIQTLLSVLLQSMLEYRRCIRVYESM